MVLVTTGAAGAICWTVVTGALKTGEATEAGWKKGVATGAATWGSAARTKGVASWGATATGAWLTTLWTMGSAKARTAGRKGAAIWGVATGAGKATWGATATGAVLKMGWGTTIGAGAAGAMGSTKPSSFKSSLNPSRAIDLKPLGVATRSPPTTGVRGPVVGPWLTSWGAAQAAAKRVDKTTLPLMLFFQKSHC